MGKLLPRKVRSFSTLRLTCPKQNELALARNLLSSEQVCETFQFFSCGCWPG